MTIITNTDNITLDTAKSHLVVEHDLDNDLVQLYLDATLDYANAYIFKYILGDVTTILDAERQETYSNFLRAPSKVEIYDINTLVTTETDEWTYVDGILTISYTQIDPYDIIVTTDTIDNNSIIAARLLFLGSLYANRENEGYNIKEMPIGVKTLLDLAQGSNL